MTDPLMVASVTALTIFGILTVAYQEVERTNGSYSKGWYIAGVACGTIGLLGILANILWILVPVILSAK